ncbi:MAG: glycosyltransferase [Candidatus Thorarchaeota archaeon]
MTKKVIFIHENLSHPTKKNIYQNPPKNIKFLFSNNSKQIVGDRLTESTKTVIIKLLNKIFGILLDRINLPRITIVLPSKKVNFDYVLSNFSLVLSTRKQILGPFEHIGDIVGYKYNKLKSAIGRKFLKWFILSSRCKYVFFMSESSKESFSKFLKIPEKKSSKMHIIYPTMIPFPKKKKTSNKISLLYIARLRKVNPEYSFYIKGGHLVLKAYEKLKAKYNNLKLIFVGYVPPEYQDRLGVLRDVECYLKGYNGSIMDLYQRADIFLFPSYIDGFGFTIIEAMANSLPVVCLNNHFAPAELVINGETGFTVNTSLKYLRFPFRNFYPDWIKQRRFYDYIRRDDDQTTLKEFITKIEMLIQNNDLRKKFGEKGRERLSTGDLSYSNRNKKLETLFG